MLTDEDYRTKETRSATMKKLARIKSRKDRDARRVQGIVWTAGKPPKDSFFHKVAKKIWPFC